MHWFKLCYIFFMSARVIYPDFPKPVNENGDSLFIHWEKCGVTPIYPHIVGAEVKKILSSWKESQGAIQDAQVQLFVDVYSKRVEEISSGLNALRDIPQNFFTFWSGLYKAWSDLCREGWRIMRKERIRRSGLHVVR
jgi:hypothetical protein